MVQKLLLIICSFKTCSFSCSSISNKTLHVLHFRWTFFYIVLQLWWWTQFFSHSLQTFVFTDCASTCTLFMCLFKLAWVLYFAGHFWHTCFSSSSIEASDSVLANVSIFRFINNSSKLTGLIFTCSHQVMPQGNQLYGFVTYATFHQGQKVVLKSTCEMNIPSVMFVRKSFWITQIWTNTNIFMKL